MRKLKPGCAWRDRWAGSGELRTHCHEGYYWLERLLAIGGAVSVPVRAKALRFAGIFASYVGELGHARVRCEESLALAREVGDPWSIAWALGSLGFYIEPYSDVSRAMALLEEALALFREIGDGIGISHALRRLGINILLWGDGYERATALTEEALTLARQAEDKNATTWALTMLGIAVWSKQGCPASDGSLRGVLISSPRHPGPNLPLVCNVWHGTGRTISRRLRARSDL